MAFVISVDTVRIAVDVVIHVATARNVFDELLAQVDREDGGFQVLSNVVGTGIVCPLQFLFPTVLSLTWIWTFRSFFSLGADKKATNSGQVFLIASPS